MAMKTRSQRMRVDRISERGTREASKEVTIKLSGLFGREC